MTDFQVKICRANALSEADCAEWQRMRAANPALYSPYFHVDYTRRVGEMRDDGYVAIALKGGTPMAFLPYQGPKTGKSGFARPIGAPMTDYQGVIHTPDADIDYRELFAGAGVGAFHYSAWVGPNATMSGNHQSVEDGCVMRPLPDAQTWRTARDSSYKRHLKSHRRRVRKAEDEIGPRRFDLNSRSRDVFDQLIAWKQEKFAETGKYDVLSAGWTLDLIEKLWEDQSELRCDMHAMYFGDQLAAVDLGLTDGTTFHSWIVAYNGDFHTYAPGIQLLEALIDEAATLGYTRVDLGAGLDGYKRHYATEDVEVGNGFLAVKGPAAALSQLYGAAEKFGEKSLRDAPGKLRRRYSQIAACDDTLSGRAKAMLEAVRSQK